jgi:hypothetical protein
MTGMMKDEAGAGRHGQALWNPQAHMPTARAKRLVVARGWGLADHVDRAAAAGCQVLAGSGAGAGIDDA